MVLVPVGSKIEPGCDAGLRVLETRGYEVRRVYGYSAIDQGRSQMATDALGEGFEELMWIDADVEFDPDDVTRLRRHDRPMTCGIYPKKGQRAFASNFHGDTKTVKFGTGGGLLPIAAAGVGFTHTRREVYEAIRSRADLPTCNEMFGETLVPYVMPMVASAERRHAYLAEDFAFCERARRAGIDVLADTRIARDRIIGSSATSLATSFAASHRRGKLVG